MGKRTWIRKGKLKNKSVGPKAQPPKGQEKTTSTRTRGSTKGTITRKDPWIEGKGGIPLEIALGVRSTLVTYERHRPGVRLLKLGGSQGQNREGKGARCRSASL